MRFTGVLFVVTIAAQPAYGQDRTFAGGAIGVTTLSADGKAEVGAAGSNVSGYKPENGAAYRAFGGRHFTDYLSAEVNYTWTRNAAALTATEFRDARESAYDETRRLTQQAFGADVMLYFRGLRSRFRPYLSAGPGLTHLAADSPTSRVRRGPLPPPAPDFRSTKPHLRVAVGIDARIARGWALRFTFAETIGGNPVSQQLTPRGERNLAAFQNLFGFVKTF